jgi:hypothetical protein
MMSVFRNLASTSFERLDASFGEAIELRRVAAGEFVRQSDDDGVFMITGVLDIPAEDVRGFGGSDGATSEVIAQQPTVEFAASIFDGDVPLPQDGDEITATDRPNAPRYRVLAVKPDGVSRVVCQLAPL